MKKSAFQIGTNLSTMGFRMKFFIAVLFLCIIPSLAEAHPVVEEARRQYESADFAGALETLSRANEIDDLYAISLRLRYRLSRYLRVGLRYAHTERTYRDGSVGEDYSDDLVNVDFAFNFSKAD